MDKLDHLEQLAADAGATATMIKDSAVAQKDSPDYWLMILDDWDPVRYDTLPTQLPNGMTHFGQLVHFEKVRPFSDLQPKLEQLIAAGRLARSGLVGGATTPPPPLPPGATDVASALARFPFKPVS